MSHTRPLCCRIRRYFGRNYRHRSLLGHCPCRRMLFDLGASKLQPSSSPSTPLSIRLDRSVWPESSVSLDVRSLDKRHMERCCYSTTVCSLWRTGHLRTSRILLHTDGLQIGNLTLFSVPIQGLCASTDSSSRRQGGCGMNQRQHLQ